MDYQKFISEHLVGFQSLCAYGDIYGLSRIVSESDNAIAASLGCCNLRSEYVSIDCVAGLDYFRSVGKFAIERLVRDYGVSDGCVPNSWNMSIVEMISNIAQILEDSI